ncbi:MAG: tetraacyldisaccharide 4'-kinase [Myxococcota bacterium]|nr:tetraacyldisaccharide 4'-kinase [Myxococcota bacterium]
MNRGRALAPLGWLYGLGARFDRWSHASHWRRVERLLCHVVGVGNLVVGGAGKTPTAAWLACALRDRGHRVVLASRGYGRRDPRNIVVVSDGKFVRAGVEAAGDEPLVLAAHAPGVPVLVGRDRARVGWRAHSAFGAEVLVLDDGFQHHRLHRDLDIVLFDGQVGFGNGRCLPAGPLREPPAALRSAACIGVVDGPLATGDEALVAKFAPGARRFAAHRRPAALRPLAGGPGQAPEALRGREVGVFSGLARPGGLRRSIEALGARVVAERRFRDHHTYRPGDLSGLADEAPLWVTSEKDAVKLPAKWAGAADVRVLTIDIEVEAPDLLLDWMEARLR